MKLRILLFFGTLLFAGNCFAAACIPAPGQHCVDFTWTASPSPGVTYNLFRSTIANACVTGTQIQGGITGTAASDMNPTNGATYFYGLNAQNSGGKSACTVDVQVLVPTPPQPPTNPSATVQ
jgi:hypothetical protein